MKKLTQGKHPVYRYAEDVDIMPSERKNIFIPRTPLGRKLVELRNKAINLGMRLFSEKEVLDELKRRRGGFIDSDKNNMTDN